MKVIYENWTDNFPNIINNLWRIEDEIEKLSNSPTKEEFNVILSNLQMNINKSIWGGCPIGRKKKIEDESPYSNVIGLKQADELLHPAVPEEDYRMR